MRTVAVREDIRDLILDAAERLLGRYGFKKMTMDYLAQEVGVAKGTIYLHFSSKEEVALARVDRVIAKLGDALLAVSRSQESSPVRLRKMLMLRVLFRFDNVSPYAESLSEQLAAIRPKLQTRRKKYFRDEAEIFAAVLQEGKREKTFFFEDADYIAHSLIIATNALLPFNLNAGELSDRSAIEERIRQISQILVNGLTMKN